MAAGLAVASPAATAPASKALRLGQVAPASADPGSTCGSCAAFQGATASGSPSYRLPAGKWTITSWKTRNISTESRFARLYVFHRTTKGRYTLVGQSVKETLPPKSATYFSTNIRARKGDVIGLDSLSHMITGFASLQAGDVENGIDCHPHPGDTIGPGTGCHRFGFANTFVNVAAKAHRR